MPPKRKSTSKRKSPPKRTSKSKKIAAGLTGLAGLSALVALAYKKGLFDELAKNVQRMSNHVQEQPISSQLTEQPTDQQVPDVVESNVGPEQGPLPNPVQKQYMLQSISKILMKPISEIENGISQDDVSTLMKNNINIEDIKGFVRINK